MGKGEHNALTMKAPASNPFFISIEGLEQLYERFEFQLLKDTGCLWRWLSDLDEITFEQMHFYGLADFFTEIAMSYAYYLALKEVGVSDSCQLLYFANNVVLRNVACWDRMAYALNAFLVLELEDKDIKFDKVVQVARQSPKTSTSIRKKIARLKKMFDKGRNIREWRNIYLHRHGEYFEKQADGMLQFEYFTLSRDDRKEALSRLEKLLEPSFQILKEAMIICSEIFFN